MTWVWVARIARVGTRGINVQPCGDPDDEQPSERQQAPEQWPAPECVPGGRDEFHDVNLSAPND